MMWKCSLALMAGITLAGFASAQQAAEQGATQGPAKPQASQAPVRPQASQAPQAPRTRKVLVKECVPETYQVKVTTWESEMVDQTVRVPHKVMVEETRTRPVIDTEWVTEMRECRRTVVDCVPTEETRTVYRKVTTCQPVTTIKRTVVDNGHWECIEVPTLCHQIKEHFHAKHPCRKGGCDSLMYQPMVDTCWDNGYDLKGGSVKGGSIKGGVKGCEPVCEPVCEKPIPTRTKRVWKSCPQVIETPCTKMQRVTECVPETITVCVNKKVYRTEVDQKPVRVCKKTCRMETYTVPVCKTEWTTETRQVCRKVPVVNYETRTRYVTRCTEQEVAIEDCEASCGLFDGGCDLGCGIGCGKLGRLAGRIKAHKIHSYPVASSYVPSTKGCDCN
jgi:hypothetical protein